MTETLIAYHGDLPCTHGRGLRILAESSRFGPTKWGIVLADVARLVATARGSSDRDAAEQLVEMRRVFASEVGDPTDTMKVSKVKRP